MFRMNLILLFSVVFLLSNFLWVASYVGDLFFIFIFSVISGGSLFLGDFLEVWVELLLIVSLMLLVK